MRRSPAFWFLIAVCLISAGALPGTGKAQTASALASAPSVRSVPLITQAIDESRLVTLRGTIHPFVAHPSGEVTDEGVAPDALPISRSMLMLNRTASQQTALETLLNAQQNPRSANYHHWLTPAQFGAQFGANPQDVAKITQWLASYGFQVDPPMAGQSLLLFSGTHAQLKAAFHTELHTYKLNGQTYYANTIDPQIPAALAPAIGGFVSLNDFPRHAMHSAPELVKRSGSTWKLASPATGAAPRAQFTTSSNNEPLYALGPYDLATIYNALPLWNAGIDGTGQTIAIISDSDINPADVDYFRTTFGLPPKKLNILYFGPNPGATGDESEADLDVQWSGAVAQGATIDLVVAADTPTSGGIDGAAAYIINNNIAPIMNLSYGACEYELGPQGNLYYSELWQQAAAQGITVLVASGDSGSAGCDNKQYYSHYGLAVSGMASTPYNVAVGGTDLYGSFTAPSQYWNDTNNSSTLASAKSYIPELPWNNSCASPQILAALQSLDNITDATPEAACNDAEVQGSFMTTGGGSGGASSCVISNGSSVGSCLSGYAKPAWQSGVAGIPTDGVRDLPDVSLMAGSGLWGSFYVFCESDATPSGTCDVNNALEGAGGTSFASPIFAGILALVEQKTASQQGNVNYNLYKLAAAQYADSNNTSCTSANVAGGNACVFYDINQGTNAVPCLGGTPNCSPSNGYGYGILPGYDATTGYDEATGLGTVNIANLVNNWTSASSTFLPTTTALATTQNTTIAYGEPLTLNVTVAPAGNATGTPSGLVGITSNSATPNSDSVGNMTLSGGQASGQITTLITGTYQVFAQYAGDATFAPSQSTGISVTVTPGTAAASLTSNRPTLQPTQKALVVLSVTGIPYGATPTGTVTFTDASNGATLGSTVLAPSSTSSASPMATAYVTISPTQLDSGSNTITASYSGDSNYLPIASTSVTVDVAGSFTTSITPASLTLSPDTSGTVTVTATPASGSLNPATFSFTCPANLPSGLTCSFGAISAAAGGAVSSTLTLQLASPLVSQPVHTATAHASRGLWLSGAAAAMAGILFFGLPARRRRIFLPFVAIACVALQLMIGCGGSSKPSQIATTTTLSISPANPTLNGAVTLTANVAPNSGTGTPTGTVSFLAGSATLGTATLAGGAATYNTTALPIGTTSLTASYGGDSNYTASASTASKLDVVYSTTLAITGNDGAGDTSSASLAVTVE